MSKFRLSFVLSFVVALAGCGGGGSTGSNTPQVVYADGLGVSGVATGTTVVGQDANPIYSTSHPSVVLADDGKAMAVWVTHGANYLEDSFAWNQSNANGVWATAQPLSLGAGIPNYDDSITLRANSAGNAVLGWIEFVGQSQTRANRAARFINGSGWDATKFDISGDYSYPSSWDLAMLDDDSYVSRVTTYDSSSGIYTYSLLRQPGAGATEYLFGLQSSSWAQFTAHAVRPDGNFVQYWVAPDATGGYEVKARFAAVGGVAFASFPVASVPAVCAWGGSSGFYFNPMMAATSPTFHNALVIVAGESDCTKHDLELVRIDTSGGISIEATRVNSPNTIVTMAPVIVMDKDGNALAVWKEAPYNDSLAPAQLMWSASLAGGAWSTAAPVITNLSAIGRVKQYGEIALAMNANGEAIAAIRTEDSDTSLVNPSVSVGKFKFASGWADWSRVANKTNISTPAVAINASGSAIVMYSALDVDRVNGKAAQGWSGSTVTKVFALRM
ncbi:MAG: hypothetical protein HZB47_01045 [Nitrosomonadales bacterium]|nr:hypothetical protein [Nitrosomonadales bacterium]